MRIARVLLLLAVPALAACSGGGAPAQHDSPAAAVGGQDGSQPGGAIGARPGGEGGAPPGSQAQLLAQLGGSRWQLVEGLSGHDPARVQVTLEFEPQGRIAGTGGCNSYSAELRATDGTVQVGPVAATKRGCEDARNQVEMAWFAALERITTLAREGESLLLLGEGLRLRLTPAH